MARFSELCQNIFFIYPQRKPQKGLFHEDLLTFLARQRQEETISSPEIDSIVHALQVLPSSNIYYRNVSIMKWVSDGYPLKPGAQKQKDLHIGLLDHDHAQSTVFKLLYQIDFKVVNQIEIVGTETRITDAILLRYPQYHSAIKRFPIPKQDVSQCPLVAERSHLP